MGGACGMHGREEIHTSWVCCESLKESESFEDLKEKEESY
jgi:hypothetical protein